MVVALVEQGGLVLVAKKRVVPGHFLSGAWHVPGGRVEAGESLEEAVQREMREEAGLEVEVVGSLGTVEVAAHGARAHWYRCAPRTLQLRAGGDVAEVEFVSPPEAARRFPPGSERDFPPAVRLYFGLGAARPG